MCRDTLYSLASIFRDIETLFLDLEPLIEVDPLLLYSLIYICPNVDFHKIIPKILPFLSISFIAKKWKKRTAITESEVNVIVSQAGSAVEQVLLFSESVLALCGGLPGQKSWTKATLCLARNTNFVEGHGRRWLTA